MSELKVILKQYQDAFLFNNNRFPALVAGIGTGKTMMLLLKIWNYCQAYPDSLALIVRKEFTDLKDSTVKDFESYFKVRVDAHKEFRFNNGSVIMFRHGGEINVLKNINLSIFGIEQAEEFEIEDVFTFLRDRLRRQNAPYRQGCIIANTNGHNWIWKLWKNSPSNKEFFLTEAHTFQNEDNLPKDFIEDLKRMEQDAPHHFRRYVMNSWEEMESDDVLYTFDMLQKSIERKFPSLSCNKRILAVDVSRYGDNETVFTTLENRGAVRWEQTHLEAWKPGDHVENRTMQIVGKIGDLKFRLAPDIIVIDDDGVGGGVCDRLGEMKIDHIRFRNIILTGENLLYGNTRTQAAFTLQELLQADYIKLYDDPEMIDQLMTLKYFYRSDKIKLLVPKEVMRKKGIKSPDRADALIMAVHCIKMAFTYQSKDMALPKYANTNDNPLMMGQTKEFSGLPRTASVDTRI